MAESKNDNRKEFDNLNSCSNLEFIMTIFARAGKSTRYHGPILANWGFAEESATLLKKRLGLGFFKRSTAITIDELAEMLFQEGIVSSIDEGKEVLPRFRGERVPVRTLLGGPDMIAFEKPSDFERGSNSNGNLYCIYLCHSY
ncbi:MAG: hypothetical protein AABX79_01490 [Nanoarchaeota archaeon]